MKYAFIEEWRTIHCVRRMCDVLEVSRAGYYEWRSWSASSRAKLDDELHEELVRAHCESRGTYGRPRIHAELAANGWRVGAKRIARLMRRAGVQGVYPRRFRKTTDSSHLLPIAQNRVRRRFSVNEIQTTDQIWAGDITYLRTHEGWLYLAVVLDLASRRVIGWSMASTMQRELVMTPSAQQFIVGSRRPAQSFTPIAAANTQVPISFNS